MILQIAYSVFLYKALPHFYVLFRDLIHRANSWLQTNKHVTVMSCETVTWAVTSQEELNNTELVVAKTTTANSKRNYYMRGLRYIKGLVGAIQSKLSRLMICHCVEICDNFIEVHNIIIMLGAYLALNSNTGRL